MSWLSAISEGPERKILVTGGRLVGKTTFLRSAVSVRTDTRGEASAGFARVLVSGGTLCLFESPDLTSAWYAWSGVCQGACGAVVLIDGDRLGAAFPILDVLSTADMPYIVAFNRFHGFSLRRRQEIREALALERAVGLVPCDVSEPDSVRAVLTLLLAEITDQRRIPPAVPQHISSPAEESNS